MKGEQWLVDEIKRELNILVDHVRWSFEHRHILANCKANIKAYIQDIRLLRNSLRECLQ